MFKKSLKLMLLSFLCIFLMSCTFVTENTGYVQFTLPSSSYFEITRKVDSRMPSDIKYHIVVTGDKNNIKPFSYDAESYSGNILIKSMPVGNYKISITGNDDKYTYFMTDYKASDFKIHGGERTKLNISLSREENGSNISKPKGNLEIKFKNPPTKAIQLKVTLYKNESKINDYYVYSNNSLTTPTLDIGKDYKIEVTGENETHKFYYSKSNIEVKQGRNYHEVTLEKKPK